MTKRELLEKDIEDLLGSIDERVEQAYEADENPYKRGAQLSICKKRLKRELFDIYCIHYIDELDLTYDLTKRLASKLLGRGISTRHILENYATQYRTGVSINHKKSVDSLIYNYFGSFNYNLVVLNSKFKNKLEELKQ